MSKNLISILCGETYWGFDNYVCTIAFKENGTGELRCQAELCVWIAAEFDWKLQSVSQFDPSIDINSIDPTPPSKKPPTTTPHLISQFAIEITLSKRLIPIFKSWAKPGYQPNETNLLDEAFRPKIYTARLEKGNFLRPCDIVYPKEEKFTSRFALRLAFDMSPYPPREEWRHPDGAPDAVRMWEWKDFCARESAELKALARRGEEPWWGKCVVS